MPQVRTLSLRPNRRCNSSVCFFPRNGAGENLLRTYADVKERPFFRMNLKPHNQIIYVELPEVSDRQHIKAETRRGVAVEYLAEPKTA